jgi:hypothetical protein
MMSGDIDVELFIVRLALSCFEAFGLGMVCKKREDKLAQRALKAFQFPLRFSFLVTSLANEIPTSVESSSEAIRLRKNHGKLFYHCQFIPTLSGVTSK